MIHLLDTSALKWAYIPGRQHRRCRQIIGRLHGQVYVSEVSILELISAFGSEFRGKRITLPRFEAADRRFFEDLAAGRIQVRSFPSSEYRLCIFLVKFVGVDRGRNITSMDAIIAHTARQLAIENHQKVKLLTCDQRLARVVGDIELFKQLVKPVYLEPH